MAANMVGTPLACDEQKFNGTKLDYARVYIELDAQLPMVRNFQLQCRLSLDHITIMVEYEWKP